MRTEFRGTGSCHLRDMARPFREEHRLMNSFLSACGATGPLQLSIECQGAPRAEVVAFDQPFLLIGRDPNSDLHFPHAEVSDRHVYLQVVGGHLCYVDLGSRSGTYLEGRCLRSGWLPLNKTLRIGPYRIRLIGGIAEEPARAASAAGAGPAGIGLPPLKDAAPAPLTLELSHRGIRPSTCPLHGELTLVGSSTDCDVRVLDPSVSNYHASLLRTPDGVWVVDLLGLAGVTVNGQPVRYARVDDGDELRLGQSLVRVGQRSNAADEPDTEEPVETAGLPVAAADSIPRTRPGEVMDAFLAPLVDQFRIMQRELFDQLRVELAAELSRSGAELLRELTAAHHEHIRSLQQQLDQFQRLNQELDTIKTGLVADADSLRDRGGPGLATRPARLGTATAVNPLRPFTLNTKRTCDDEVREAESEGERPLAAAFAITPSETERQDEPGDPPITTEEAHAWLYQRISMIQDEQQGRWRKLLDGIPGQLLARLSV